MGALDCDQFHSVAETVVEASFDSAVKMFRDNASTSNFQRLETGMYAKQAFRCITVATIYELLYEAPIAKYPDILREHYEEMAGEEAK